MTAAGRMVRRSKWNEIGASTSERKDRNGRFSPRESKKIDLPVQIIKAQIGTGGIKIKETAEDAQGT